MATNAVIGALRVNLGIDTAAFRDGLKDAQKSLGRMGKRLQGIGQDLSVKVSAPLAAIGGLSLKAFSDFEQGLIGVGKTTDITGDQLAELGRGVQSLAQEIPVATTELLGIAQAAGQLGVTGNENILRFTETVGKLGISTNLAGEEAATALARILTVTGTALGDVDRLGATFVRLGNNFAATEAEISQAATRVAQATAQFGASAADVAGIATALTAVGVQAEAGGTVINRAFQAINDAVRQGGKELQAFVEITGRGAEELRALFQEDPTKAFQALVDGLNRISREGGDVTAAMETMGLSGVRVNQVLGTLATRSEVLSDALGQARDEWRQNIALNREAAVATKSFASQTQLARNSLNEAATAMGRVLAPAAASLMESLAGILRALSGVNPQVLKFSAIVAGIAAVVGPVLIVLGALAAAIAAVGVPVAGVIAGIGLLAAGIIAFWEDVEPVVMAIRDGFVILWQRIMNDVNAVKAAFTAFAEFIDQPLGDMVEQTRGFMVDQLGAIWGRVKTDLQAIRGVFVSIFGEEIVATFEQFHIDMFEIATAMMTKLRDTIAGGFEWIGGKIKGTIDFITSIWRDHEDEVVGNSIVPDMIDAIIRQFQRLPMGVGQPTQAAVDGVVDSFVRGSGQAQVAVAGLGQTAQRTAGEMNSSLRSTARGALGDLMGTLREGETSWRSYAQIALDALDQIVNKLLNDVLNAIFKVNGASGSGGGGILGGLSSLLGLGGGLTTTGAAGTGSFGAGNAAFGTLGFAHGGAFTVGGPAAVDKSMVAFRASRGERVTIDPPGGRRGGDGGNVYNIDARGADMAAVQRLERSLMELAGPGRVERRAVTAVSSAQHRGQRLGPRG